MPLAVLAGAVPLVACQPAPFTDWPNHIARVFIGVRLLLGDAFWARFYGLNPVPVPNEALDLGIGALNLAGLGVDTAAMVFLLFAYAVFVAGFVTLARAFGARGAGKPLLGAILFLTGPLMYGLVNYMLGLGAAMGLVGPWSRGGARRRWLLAVIGTPLLFLVHLMGAAIWVVLIFCVEAPVWITSVRRGGRAMDPGRLLAGASSLGAAFVLAVLVLASPVGADSLPRADGSNIYFMGQETLFGVLRWKALIFARIFSDHARLPAAGATLLGIAALLLCIWRGGRARLARPAWLACVVVLAAVLTLPESAGTGSLLDYRLALVPVMIAAAAIEIDWRRPGPRRAAFALLLAILIGRAASFTAGFADEQAVYTDFDRVARALPPNSMLLAARGRADADISDQEWWSPPVEHLGSRAVYASVFVPTVFAVASQQPVVLRPAFAPWRRSWRIATAPEFAAMSRDIAPLCRASAARGVTVALFVAYPGQYVSRAVAPPSIVAKADRFEVIDVCMATRSVWMDKPLSLLTVEPSG